MFIVLYQNDVDFNRTKIKAALFYPLQKTLWTVCLWWISYACISGNVKFINWFLSLTIFQILSKISYCTYLVHFLLIIMHIGYSRTLLAFSDYEGVIAKTICLIFFNNYWVLVSNADSRHIYCIWDWCILDFGF